MKSSFVAFVSFGVGESTGDDQQWKQCKTKKVITGNNFLMDMCFCMFS